MSVRTRAGLLKFRPVTAGSRVALVAPASPFDRAEFDAGVAEVTRLGLEPVYDDSVFDRHPIVAGSAEQRARAFMAAATGEGIDAVLSVRGGYGSAELLPYLDRTRLARARTAVIGYSDLTSLHAFLNGHVPLASVHGAMIDGRLSKGSAAYDRTSFLASLGTSPLGDVAAAAELEVLKSGEAAGPLFGGTLTQLAASLGTPFAFAPPGPYVLFFEDVGERPYRIRRLLTQLAQSGRLADAVAVVVGSLNRCDEPNGTITGQAVVSEFFSSFSGPVVYGFPSGHTDVPFVSMPLGVEVRVVAPAAGRAMVVFEEAAAG